MESKDPPLRTARIVVAACAAALVLKLVLADVMIADGRSMLPTIQSGRILLVCRAAYGLRVPFLDGYLFRWASPRKGDIVVFPAPDGLIAVKRVDDNLDGKSVVAVGDNSGESYDSRQYGPVAVDSILGKVIGIK